MNAKLCFLILLLGTTLITSCKKDNFEYGSDYNKSYKAWKQFQSSSNDNYRYVVYSGSVFGFSSQTTITVEAGKVTKRSYVQKGYGSGTNQEIVITGSWDETATTINSHQGGASSITLEEVYQKAKNDWLLKREKHITYFEAKNDGMISSCGHWEDGCQDDCSIGITILSIEKI